MKAYEFGDASLPVIVLLPGTCCHWHLFDNVVPLLSRHFHVVVISYDGFDETEPGAVHPTQIEEAAKIEDLILERFDGNICAAYGCSLGGSIVGLMVERRRVRINHAIIGSSDLDQAGPVMARLQSAIMVPVMHKMLATGQLPGFMQRRLETKTPNDRAYTEAFLKTFGVGDGARDMSFVQRESVRNQFYYDLTTPLGRAIAAPGTTVHVFYALKMGEKYEARYLEHFANPDIRRHDMNHEELFFAHPQQWCSEVLSCCGMPE